MRRILFFGPLALVASFVACSSDYSSDAPAVASIPDAGIPETGTRDAPDASEDGEAPASLSVSTAATTLTFDSMHADLSFGIDLHPTGTLPGPVKVTLTGLPAGILADSLEVSIDDPVSRPSAGFRLYRAAATPVGTYPLTATATSGSLVATTTLSLAVTYGKLVPGQLDTAFGTAGVARVGDEVGGYAILPDGSFYTGPLVRADADSFLLKKYAVDGTLQSMASVPVAMNPEAICVEPSGALIVAGRIGDSDDLSFIRISPLGGVDFAFNGTGVLSVTPPPNNTWSPTKIVASADHIFVSLLATGTDLAPNAGSRVLRITPAGALDSSFVSPDHDTTLPDLAIVSSSLTIAAGSVHPAESSVPTAIAFGFDAAGTLKTTPALSRFGGDSAVFSAIARADADGSVVAFGGSFDGNDSYETLARFHPDGTLDTAFGTGGLGYTQTILPNGTIGGASATTTKDGHFAAFGMAGIAFDVMVVARFTADGQLDPSFGTGGHSSQQLPTGVNLFDSGRIIDNGEVLVVAVNRTDGFFVFHVIE